MIKTEEILKEDYKYNIGSKLKLQNMHKEGLLKVVKSDKTFDNDLNKAIQNDLDVTIVFLWACQSKWKLEEISESVYSCNGGDFDKIQKALIQKAYIAIQMSINPVNFLIALKKFMKLGQKKQTITQI